MKDLISTILVLVILGLPLGLTGCSEDNPTSPNPHVDDWFPLAEGITAVWEHTDYDDMGMAGRMHADTTVAMMMMNGADMYYAFGAELAMRSGSPKDSICLMMRHDSLFARDFAAMTEPHEVLVALFPPRTGVVWNSGWESHPTKWSSVGQSVTVTAGSFADVAILQIGPMGADSSYKEFWFAEDTGVIQAKMWIDRIEGSQHNVMLLHTMQMRKITIP